MLFVFQFPTLVRNFQCNILSCWAPSLHASQLAVGAAFVTALRCAPAGRPPSLPSNPAAMRTLHQFLKSLTSNQVFRLPNSCRAALHASLQA